MKKTQKPFKHRQELAKMLQAVKDGDRSLGAEKYLELAETVKNRRAQLTFKECYKIIKAANEKNQGTAEGSETP